MVRSDYMSKKRIYEYAKELNLKSKEIIDEIKSMNVEVSNHMKALEEDFIILARSKGISEFRVVVKHALRNALVPTVTILGMQIGWMMGATVLVEEIFGRPGIGKYAVKAVTQSDIHAIVGVVLIVGVIFIISNLIVDIIHFFLNPRLRYN
jgi:peptide/nickel transport system permease protein